jgi:enoyl-CoA hydratase/carnithine racemase
MPQVVVAQVNGPAAGGGLALVCAADVRIAAEGAVLASSFIRTGVTGCDVGGSWLLPRLVGAGRAHELMRTARRFDATPDPVTAHFVRTRGGAALALHRLSTRLPDRLEARLHGACTGPGVELPAFAGRVVADPGTTFQLPEVGMGLIPGAGGTVGIPRRIGRWRTLHLALSGQVLDASTAWAWGLVDEIAPV